MKLLVLGASGRIGSELVRQALARGLWVTALVRDRRKLPMTHAHLDIVVGNPTDESLLADRMAGRDAVVSTLGHNDLSASSLVTDAALATTRAMSATTTRRLVIISSTLVAAGGSVLTVIPRLITRHALSDSAEMEKVVRGTPLDWTLLRLSRLTNGAVTAYQLRENAPPSVRASVSRSTVATCILDRLNDAATFRRTLSIESAEG